MGLNIQDFYNCPNVYHKDWEDLVLFSYTRECQYDKIWNDITLASRGLIFNKVTGKLVFRCQKKFFNLNEIEFTKIENLPNIPFTVTNKVDGIMGILFQYKGQTYVSTRGSFTSPYAYWATDWARKSMKTQNINPAYSYHFEIIYKGGKIVIDYGDKEHLVLICVVETETGRELSYEELRKEAQNLGVEPVEAVQANSIAELYDIAKTLDATNEGFVVTFSNGLKVKIKGKEYCRLHRAIMDMTPIVFWENWKWVHEEIPEGVSKELLVQLPEEYREEVDSLAKAINESHMNEYIQAKAFHEEIFKKIGDSASDKVFAEEVGKNYKKYSGQVFGYHTSLRTKNWWSFWWGVHKKVRPTFNIIPNSDNKITNIRKMLEEEN